MKPIATTLVSVLLVVTLVFGIATAAMAGKPQDVIEKSNGFPSGPHFNLNIHGKKFDYNCDPAPGGGSVFMCEYGESKIQYVSNKKSSLTQLVVFDPCSECFENAPDDNPVTVMLPHKIQLDTGEVVETGGFFVFGRILGKPNNGKNDPESSVILGLNEVMQACNDDPNNPDPNFGDYTSCDEVALGLIVGPNVYDADPEVYRRFDPTATRGKGKSKATDITRLFTYEGWVSWGACPDTDDNGEINDDDIPDGWATKYDPSPDLNGDDVLDVEEWILYHPDTNCDGVIDEVDATTGGAYAMNYGLNLDTDFDQTVTAEEWLQYQASLGHSTYMTDQWIFNIADLVFTQQGFVNDGTRLLQIRFYPRATTEFVTE